MLTLFHLPVDPFQDSRIAHDAQARYRDYRTRAGHRRTLILVVVEFIDGFP
jgi:hypothetical protein